MNDAFVEKRIAEYSKMRKLYQDFAEQILSIIKNILLAEHPEIKIASCSSRAKEISRASLTIRQTILVCRM